MGLDLNDLIPRRMVLTLPGMEDTEVRKDIPYKSTDQGALLLDIYLPRDVGNQPLPAVMLVSGNAAPELMRDAKDWGSYVSAGQLLAASGMIGVSFNKRTWQDLDGLEEAATDVEDAIDYVRAHAADLGVDPDRMALWVFSAGPPAGLRHALRDTPPYLRCLVVYYGVMDLRQSAEGAEEEHRLPAFSPVTYLERNAGAMPRMLLVRAGQDNPRLNDTVDRFVTGALKHNAPLELINFPVGHHAFDILDDVPQSRRILARTLSFLAEHLKS